MMSRHRIVRPGILAAIFGALIAAPLLVSSPLVSSLRGQDATSSRPSGRTGSGMQPAPGRGPSLSSDMKAMATAWGKLKGQISDPAKNDSSLDLVSQFEGQTALAKGVLPPNIAKMPEADRKDAAEKYRGMLRDILHKSLDLEDQLIAGDNTKAAATIGAIEDIEKSGHAEFRGRGRG